jgi:hypothetical protein
MIAAADIEAARAASLLHVIEARGLRLRRQGAELFGPCPRCGTGHDRFSVNARKRLWHCRVCGRGGNDAISLVRFLDGCAFVEAIQTLTDSRPLARPTTAARAKAKDVSRSNAEYERVQHQKAAWMWSRRQPPIGSIAERYLRENRNYHGPLPPTLAFLPPQKPEHHPAMIAAFAIVGEVEPGVLAEPQNVDAVHLTFLRPDGTEKADVKPNKICVGSPDRRPITLSPPNDLLGMAFTEGIEDGLSVYAATGLGVWAAGSAPYMPALADVVPYYIECVTIYSHNDEGGRRATEESAGRLFVRGIEVFIEGLA